MPQKHTQADFMEMLIGSSKPDDKPALMRGVIDAFDTLPDMDDLISVSGALSTAEALLSDEIITRHARPSDVTPERRANLVRRYAALFVQLIRIGEHFLEGL